MTNTITELWNGNLTPIRYSGIHNHEIKQLETLMQRNLENLEKHLTPQQKNHLEKYVDCMNEYLVIVNEQTFHDGFCLGTKITVEALTGAEVLL